MPIDALAEQKLHIKGEFERFIYERNTIYPDITLEMDLFYWNVYNLHDNFATCVQKKIPVADLIPHLNKNYVKGMHNGVNAYQIVFLNAYRDLYQTLLNSAKQNPNLNLDEITEIYDNNYFKTTVWFIDAIKRNFSTFYKNTIKPELDNKKLKDEISNKVNSIFT